MFRQYREIKRDEAFLVGADCAQGGNDYNACQFFSRNKKDIPLVYHTQGVAARMTMDILSILEKLYDISGIRPLVAFERQNGGASEMERLRVYNREGKYKLFTMPVIGHKEEDKETVKLGYDNTSINRPTLIGDLKNFIDAKAITIYDEKTVDELFSFIVNKQGKAEAQKGSHDDLVISLAICLQLYQITKPENTEAHLQTKIRQVPTEELFTKEGFY